MREKALFPQESVSVKILDIEILSLFPEYFEGPLRTSILKRAQEAGLLRVSHVQIRDYACDRHKTVDDRPYGGGPGMVMKPEPIAKAMRSVRREESHVVHLTPRGKPLNARLAREMAKHEHLILLCGHYEGIDERVLEAEVDEEICVGDYVLTNGCLAALVLIDAAARFVPGVLGDELSAEEDSFERGRLDCPCYTRPEVYEGKEVPQVLLQGNHNEIAKWREAQGRAKTKQMRPDLFEILQQEEKRNGCTHRSN